MSAYDALAWFYERYWHGPAHDLAMRAVEALVVPLVPPPAEVLDLCCGTGVLAARLARRGYRVTGVDASPGMLAVARGTAPQARFVLADAREFRLDGPRDAAVCTFDALNHLLGDDDLGATLRRVRAALRPGAPFLFDLLTLAAYRGPWSRTHTIVEDDHACFLRGGYDGATRTARADITLFRAGEGGGGWRRDDVLILERWHPYERVAALCREAGFAEPVARDAEEILPGNVLNEGRLFVLARALA